MIAKIAVATFLGEERPKVVLEGGEGVMRAFGDHLGEDARLLVRVVVERAEKRGEGNHELCGSERSLLANGYRIDFEANDQRCS